MAYYWQVCPCSNIAVCRCARADKGLCKIVMGKKILITGVAVVSAEVRMAPRSCPAVAHPFSGANSPEARVRCDLLLADDGKLSLEEFQSYFTDGILTEEQMQELYYSIDRQRTK